MAAATTKKVNPAEEEPAVEEVSTPAEDEVKADIEALEPVAKAVDRTLKHPATGETKKFVQHEMGFMTKLKFFRLLSGTIRLASEGEDVLGILDEVVNEDIQNSESFISTILKLVELVPDFAEETYIYALGAKPEEYLWVKESLDSLSDDEGLDILDVFIAQNGESVRNFFGKKLRSLAKRVQTLMPEVQPEPETTA